MQKTWRLTAQKYRSDSLTSLVGKRIELLRKTHNLSQNALAKLTKIPQSTLYAYEAGMSRATWERLHAISATLNCSIDVLINRDDTDVIEMRKLFLVNCAPSWKDVKCFTE